MFRFLIVLGIAGTVGNPFVLAQAPVELPSGDRRTIESELDNLNRALQLLREREPSGKAVDLVADVAVFPKGIEWALRYGTEARPADDKQKIAAAMKTLVDKALSRGRQRVERLQAGKPVWSDKRGRLVRGYVSAVDGSVQPYGIIVPKNYDPAKPTRLDVVLHGSTRPVGLAELNFMNRFDEGDDDSSKAPDQPYIELHPLGRVENCYRWSGETDVFEAIDDVSRKYNIDRDRIVLRGMSMGASGTWHLGLKHPDRFVALGPYCGYVDTHRFSETPLPNFVKVGPLPAHQELALHMLDSVDYAANARIVPVIACMGEKDVFFQAHVIMGEAMQREGLELVNLISPGTGHVIDPVTHADQMRQIAVYADGGINRRPGEIQFLTWTLKYNHCHWLHVLGLEHHYARSEIAARIHRDGSLQVDPLKNITRFGIAEDAMSGRKTIKIAGHEVMLDSSLVDERGTSAPRLYHFEKRDALWRQVAAAEFDKRTIKRPGLQGPIDDAFSTRFLCVRGTGQPWNRTAQAYADASLKRFAYEWNRYFRGELPVKNDSEVTENDLRTCNLILFGDPGSNVWIRKALPGLPITWTKETLRMAGKDYSAAGHVPALIHPNPLPGASGKYLVLNSGHTFRESELNLLNYLLFPRWGDWAVLKVGGTVPEKPGDQLDEQVLSAGFFNEAWK